MSYEDTVVGVISDELVLRGESPSTRPAMIRRAARDAVVDLRGSTHPAALPELAWRLTRTRLQEVSPVVDRPVTAGRR
jgi:hypothetical protein